MINPRQLIMERIGKDGCYFLSIVYLAETIKGKIIDAVQVYANAVHAGWMYPDCFISNPDQLLAYLTGGKWSVRKELATYRAQAGELIIQRWERREGMRTWAHFVVGDDAGQVIYDPYGESLTVRLGGIVSLRVFRDLDHVQ